VDSLSSLSAFVRAADTRSFTEAGRQLGVSSSAIGKSIARLEVRLGVRLFHRSTRSITLTQEGVSFLDSCRRIFAEIDAVETEFADSKGAPRGKLRVSLPMVGMLMMPAVIGFMATYPDIQLDIDFTDMLVDLIEGGYDVVIRTGEGVDSRLKARTLGNYELVVVGAPAYFARAGVPVGLSDLAAHDCLHHRYPTNGKLQRWPLRPATVEDDVTLPVKAAITTISPLVAMAEAGLGIACVPDFAIRHQLRSGSLVRILDDCRQHKGVFRAVWPSSRHLPPKTRAFIDFMAENLFAPATTTPPGYGSEL
jgi:DNA-binding transcriptional LysR family regulator